MEEGMELGVIEDIENINLIKSREKYNFNQLLLLFLFSIFIIKYLKYVELWLLFM